MRWQLISIETNNMRKNNQPLVSVIMPVYNGSAFVAEAIESILRQTYKNIEVIIVDDASSDDTWKILLKYKRINPGKIKLIRLKENLGKGGDAAANIAFMHSKGEFVARTDADDIALPGRIEKQVEFMQKHTQYAVVGSNAHVINSSGEVVGEKKVPLKHEEIYEAYFTFHPMINPTIMVRKSLINDHANLYRNDNPTNNDYLSFMRLISQGAKFTNLPEKLMYYRIHEKNDSLAKVRRTFKHSLVTRYRAVTEFGYRPSLLAWVKLLMQIVIVYTLPERVVFQLYLLVRGIAKPPSLTKTLDRFPLSGGKALDSSI